MDDYGIFLDAVSIRDPGRRAEFLGQACRGDANLLAEVESLLRHHEVAGDFLERPPAELLGTRLGSEADTREDVGADLVLSRPEPTDRPGCLGRLDEFVIRKVLGRGGMGVVLLADDPKLGRPVAIKVMDAAFASCPVATQRFFREARAAASIRHENVVAIYGIHDQLPLRYLVLEYVEGASLQERIDSAQTLSLEEIIQIGIQAAEAIAAAHRMGLIHRDVKPGNFLLERGTGRVKLTDFGLARAVDDLNVTQVGQIAGTPNYMAPEQALGNPVDHRADLFSLGSVLYTLCTGQPAFAANSVVATLRRICDEQPVPPRQRNPEVPPWLDSLVVRLMQKDPAQRPPTAAEVAACLRRQAGPGLAGPGLAGPGLAGPGLAGDGTGNRRDSRGRSSGRRASAATRGGQLLNGAALVAVVLAGFGLIGSVLAGAGLIGVLLVGAVPLRAVVGAAGPSAVMEGPPVDSLPSTSSPAGTRRISRLDTGGTPSRAPQSRSVRFRPSASGTGEGESHARSGPAEGAVRLAGGRPGNDPASRKAVVEAALTDVAWGLHLSADGRTLVYSSLRPGGYGDGDLWLRRRASWGEDWSEPENLGPVVNGPAYDAAPSLSADGLILVFESQREGGHGTSDLWMTTRSARDQPWSPPKNLGDRINSASWQRAPALSADGRTLIYSTTFPYRRGNVLQIATRNSVDDDWSEPRPLSLPGAEEDSYQTPALSADGLTLYFSRGGESQERVVYCTRESLDAAWSEPRTLLPSWNTVRATLFPTLGEAGRTLLFVSGPEVFRIAWPLGQATDGDPLVGVVEQRGAARP